MQSKLPYMPDGIDENYLLAAFLVAVFWACRFTRSIDARIAALKEVRLENFAKKESAKPIGSSAA